MNQDALLTIKNLKTYFYTYRGVVKAVDGIDLCIRRKEIVGLAGESGSGKSVLARSILRLIQPPGRIIDGQLWLSEDNLLSLTEREMRKVRGKKIAMVFQDPLSTLNPVIKVGSQIAEAIRLHGVRQQGNSSTIHPTISELHHRVLGLMESVRIAEPQNTYHYYPHQLSGGMRQRIVLATALACNPSLLIADEPTTALDVTVQATVLELMKRIQQEYEISILFITHDLAIIYQFCDWVAIMYAGRLVEWGRSRNVLLSPYHPYTINLLQCLPHLRISSSIHPIPGEVPDLSKLPPGCAFYERCSQGMAICKNEVPPMYVLSDERKVRCFLYQAKSANQGSGNG